MQTRTVARNANIRDLARPGLNNPIILNGKEITSRGQGGERLQPWSFECSSVVAGSVCLQRTSQGGASWLRTGAPINEGRRLRFPARIIQRRIELILYSVASQRLIGKMLYSVRLLWMDEVEKEMKNVVLYIYIYICRYRDS